MQNRNELDLVIPLGKQSPFKNEELRFCLRSIEGYLLNYRNIYIIGERPEWLQNVIHIKAEDRSSHEKNILRKILIACDTEEISNEFFFMNDDHFFLKQTDITDYPYYYSGVMQDILDRRMMFTGYKQTVINTENVLRQANKPLKWFDIHCPIIYRKEFFKEAISRYDWSAIGGYVIKSLYCNTLEKEGVVMKDCKIDTATHPFALADAFHGRHVFSCGDPGFESVRPILENMFTNKSKYEL